MHKGRSKSSHFDAHGSDDHDEELWLVSYADMVTLLFGFFVILFSFSTIDDKKFEQMTEKVAEAFKSNEKLKKSESDVGVTGEERQLRAMQMLVSMLNLGESMDEAVAKIERSFAESQSAEAAKKVITERVAVEHKDLVQSSKHDDSFHTVELVLPEQALFESGSAELQRTAIKKLRDLAGDFQVIPNLMKIEVTGHTDSRPLNAKSPLKNNFALSSLRAGAVAEVLISGGISPRQLSVRGLASLEPLFPERSKDGHWLFDNMAKNRRVTILLKLRDKHDPLVH